MKNLESIHRNHKGKVSDKWELYLREYDRVFEKYRDKPISLLEIGVQNGGSLEVWSKFFTNAKVLIGCDINADCEKLEFENCRISVVSGDANVDETEKKICSKTERLDLIIDDGSHKSSDIIRSFARYFKLLDEGGMYVIEDLHCSYWEGFEGGLYDPFSSISFLKVLVDVTNSEHFGVDKTKKDIIKGYENKYNFQISESTLSKIHSIEFLNSVCIIRKSMGGGTILGKRVITGSSAEIVPSIVSLKDIDFVPEEKSNFWSNLGKSPAEHYLDLVREIENEKNEFEKTAIELDAIKRSTSWMLTRPLRTLMSFLKSFK